MHHLSLGAARDRARVSTMLLVLRQRSWQSAKRTAVAVMEFAGGEEPRRTAVVTAEFRDSKKVAYRVGFCLVWLAGHLLTL